MAWTYNNDRTIQIGKSWVDDNGVTHPRNWDFWSAQEKAAAGLTWVVPPTPPARVVYDERFYKPDGTPKSIDAFLVEDINGDPVINQDTGEQVVREGLKAFTVVDIEKSVASALSTTDRYIALYSEDPETNPVPEEISIYRQSVRDYGASFITLVENAQTFDEYVAVILGDSDTPSLQNGWPKQFTFASVDPVPSFDSETQRVEWDIVDSDGSFIKTATVVDLTSEELAARLQTWRENASVTMRQARIALFSVGQLSGVDSAIASMPAGVKEVAEIEWTYGSTIERLSPLVLGLSPALGFDSVQMDGLFTLAKTL